MRPLSLAHLTVIDLDPPAMIRLAADTGFDAVGLRLVRVTDTSPGYPLHQNPADLRATLGTLAETGMAVQDIEFLRLTPGFAAADMAAVLEAGAALGAHHVICAPYDPDLSRMADNLAALADLALPLGIAPVLEFFPWTVVPTLAAAVAVVEASGNARIGVLADALHFDRSGSALADLAALPSQRVPFLHLCDAPVAPPYSEAQLLFAGREERLPPGEGQIGLAAFLRAAPPGTPVALEVPMTAATRAHGPAHVAARVIAAARVLLAGVDG